MIAATAVAVMTTNVPTVPIVFQSSSDIVRRPHQKMRYQRTHFLARGIGAFRTVRMREALLGSRNHGSHKKSPSSIGECSVPITALDPKTALVVIDIQKGIAR